MTEFYFANAMNNMNNLSQQVNIINKLGLHARAAAKFVNISSNFDCHVEIEKNGHRVNGKSIMGVMMLAAGNGSSITLHTEGDDARECMDNLIQLVNNRFDENE